MNSHRGPGAFISFEGCDGAGKSTQVRLLAAHLERAGRSVVVTREPGATPLGAQIRSLLLTPGNIVPPRTEALLYAADRADHVAQVVRPALAAGSVVITDRYIDSSLAYQGAGRDLDLADIERISLWAVEGLEPDLTVLLDAPAAELHSRMRAAGRTPDRLESEGDSFQEKVGERFLDLAAAHPERVVVVDARDSIECIAATIADAVDVRLAQ